MSNSDLGIAHLTVIAARQYQEGLLKLLLASGCHLINVTYAKGSVKASYYTDMLGLEPREKKTLITCLVATDKAEPLLEDIVHQFHFNQPNTGIAFLQRVDSLSV